VELDDVPDDRQAEAEPEIALARRAVRRLVKTLPHVRQRFRRDADAVVAHFDDHVAIRSPHFQPHVAARLGEADGIRDQVPEHLLKTLRIGVQTRQIGVDDALEPDAFRAGRRMHVRQRRVGDRSEIDLAQREVNVTRHDA